MTSISLIMAALNCYLAATVEGHTLKVIPKGTDELFANPGMGWQTFHRFADEDKNLEGLPSASAYFRFYWSEIEPDEGQIDFAKFDLIAMVDTQPGTGNNSLPEDYHIFPDGRLAIHYQA